MPTCKLIENLASGRHAAKSVLNITKKTSKTILTGNVFKIRPRILTALHPIRKKSTRCCGGRRIVATSEFWYEEEEEFDSLTDALTRKILVIVTAPTNDQASEHAASLREYMQPLPFVCGFCGNEEVAFAATLWQGREKPPFFLKMRTRSTLNKGGIETSIQEFLAEVLQQNWRVELDAGLGVKEPEVEPIMVVCSAATAETLLRECCSGGGESPGVSREVSPGTVTIVDVGSTAAGDPAEWNLLTKTAVVVGKVPAAGETLSVL